MTPQRKGVVPPDVEKRLADLAQTWRTSGDALEREAVAAIKAGGSYREVMRITGVNMRTLQRWVDAAGGLERAERRRQELAAERERAAWLNEQPPLDD